MKNAKQYEKKVKKLLGKLSPAKPDDAFEDPVEILVQATLEADASPASARKAYKELTAEFVDLNEVRVAPTKEIIECLGKDFPRAREKSEQLVKALGRLYEKTFDVSLTHLAEMPKRQLRRCLSELGLTTYSEARVSLSCFDAHAVPVDTSLVESLKMENLIHPDSDEPDVQGFLERIISHKDAWAAHESFRKFVATHEKELNAFHQQQREQHLEKIRKADQRAKEAAEAEERARIEARTAGSDSEKAAPPAGKKKKKKGKKSSSAKTGTARKSSTKKKTASSPAKKSTSSKSAGKKTQAKKKSTASSKSASGKKAASKRKKTAAKATKKAAKKTTKTSAKKAGSKKSSRKASTPKSAAKKTKKTDKKTKKTKKAAGQSAGKAREAKKTKKASRKSSKKSKGKKSSK